MTEGKPKTSFVATLSAEQAEQLRCRLEQMNWELDTIPYARWRARHDKTSATAYESGKLVVNGRGTADLVQFTIEPEILGEVRFGYEEVLAQHEHPEMFELHAGMDESGKGDFFGPLVIAAACVDERSAPALLKAGVQDSKNIKSRTKIDQLAEIIRQETQRRTAVVAIGPEAYNRMYERAHNVNAMLGWGHARALENLLERAPDCPRALADQFGNKRSIERALMEKGRSIKLDQRPKAEADVAVAAASILARSEFVKRLDGLGEQLQIELPKGASAQVVEVAAEIIRRHGWEKLRQYAKLHFRTLWNAAAKAGVELPMPAPPEREFVPHHRRPAAE